MCPDQFRPPEMSGFDQEALGMEGEPVEPLQLCATCRCLGVCS